MQHCDATTWFLNDKAMKINFNKSKFVMGNVFAYSIVPLVKLSLSTWLCTVLFATINLGHIPPIKAQTVNPVKIWEEELTLPTYVVDPPDKNPMFFKNDSYQGASRVIYPYALEDDFTGKKVDKTYKAVYIENEFLKVCILPEIGGRLFYATDKTNGYEIFYRQHVIKPAHIGMLGAWISGGIEFCVFHHHRATTNMPVDYKLVQNDDGSATLWIGETEWRHRMKWTFGISLFPGKSYLELDGRLINSTENPNSILYWANVATSVNDDYQVIFPPSTEFAVFHSKHSFVHWPITKEPYRGNDYYTQGIDASWWKNHPGSNSFFAHDIKEGFLGGYDHGKEAGTMLVGNPHIVKGAKLWEWGKGSIWDTKVLTDSDGPYAEVMSGAYSDNQPDYSWLKPYELKLFKQYWYPMRASKGAVAANLNGLLNCKPLSEKEIYIAANTTSSYPNAKIVLKRGDQIILEQPLDIAPDAPFETIIDLNHADQLDGLQLSLYDDEENELVTYQATEVSPDTPLPNPVVPPSPPAEIASIEELYYAGLRIKQFYNARTNPIDYFNEALSRDSLDSRCNLQMGIYYKERGVYDKAKEYLRKALIRPTYNYTRPRDGEAFYQLGLVLKTQGHLDAAYDTLYRAAWDQDFASPSYFNLAQISCHRQQYNQAKVELERCLNNNASNLNAMILLAMVLRKAGQIEEAKQWVSLAIQRDPLHAWAYHEQALIEDHPQHWQRLERLLRDHPESYLELGLYYLNSGFRYEAQQIFEKAIHSSNSTLSNYPTIHYYMGYLEDLSGHADEAEKHFAEAQKLPTDYCFPFRLETIDVYQKALQYHPNDAKAHYYLGNLLYDKQPLPAIQHWEKAVSLASDFAIAHRNVGWGNYYTLQQIDKAIASYEKAIASNPNDPRYYAELDRLYELNGTAIAKRYALFANNHDVVAQHSGPLVRAAMVGVAANHFDEAIDILTNHYFNRREGRNDLHNLYIDAYLLRGQTYLRDQKWTLAYQDFQAANLFPDNLPLSNTEQSERHAQSYFLIGQALDGMGKSSEAKEWYLKASNVDIEDDVANYYQKARALQELGNQDKADELITMLAKKGEELLKGTKAR